MDAGPSTTVTAPGAWGTSTSKGVTVSALEGDGARRGLGRGCSDLPKHSRQAQLRQSSTFAKKDTGLGHGYPQASLLARKLSFQTLRCGCCRFRGVKPATQASLEPPGSACGSLPCTPVSVELGLPARWASPHKIRQVLQVSNIVVQPHPDLAACHHESQAQEPGALEKERGLFRC